MIQRLLMKRMTRLSEVAPIASLAAVLILPHWLNHHDVGATPQGPDAATVVEAVDSIPYRIGTWSGVDIPMPESAVRLLKPNATVSRRYRDSETGMKIELVVVHCGDARDMLGHYPPVCYPGSGWVSREDAENGTPVELKLGEMAFTAQMYEFSRMADWSSESHLRVFNFFVLPDGRLSSDIHGDRKMLSWPGSRERSMGQVQLVTDGEVPLDEAISAANRILEGSRELFSALAVIPDG